MAGPDEQTEEIVNLEDLASELEREDPAALELPGEGSGAPLEAAAAEGPDDNDALAPSDGDADAPSDAADESSVPDAEPKAAQAQAAPDPEGDTGQAGVGSLEALLRRRGLSTVAHVEEVEVTERGGRG